MSISILLLESLVALSVQPPVVPPVTVRVIESVEDILAFDIAFAAISAVSIDPLTIEAATIEFDFISAVSTAFAAIFADVIAD